ncbi:MAG: hypothetical protein KF830_09630 [Planctomycetes bacterium]|nr:hypothetical protein [Planctomycetota bacterium]
MRRGLAAAAATVLWAGCAAAPRDAFVAAQAALQHEDLPAALIAFDAVPVLHPRYPEARAGAAAVELRMRRGHELMLEGLIRRSEWRDAEALSFLAQAREIWPRLPGVDALLAATRQRLVTLGAGPAGGASAMGQALRTESAPAGAFGPEGDLEPRPAVAAAAAVDADPSVGLGLAAVETRLGRGELEPAVVDLLELARRFPDDQRVRRRLARVLHQRALLRYGQGALTAALLDLDRVLELEPANREVAALRRAIRDEALRVVPASPR